MKFAKILLLTLSFLMSALSQAHAEATQATRDTAQQCKNEETQIKSPLDPVLKTMLNSERIEYLFGSYNVDVLNIDSSVFPGSRIANLHSIHDGHKVMRTLAIVHYSSPVHSQLEPVHQKILAGESIGTALKKDGWKIIKQPVYFGELALEEEIVREWMQVADSSKASLHVYDLKVEKPNLAQIPYCRIIEIHSPLYLNKEALRNLYPEDFEKFSGGNHEIIEKVREFMIRLR